MAGFNFGYAMILVVVLFVLFLIYLANSSNSGRRNSNGSLNMFGDVTRLVRPISSRTA